MILLNKSYLSIAVNEYPDARVRMIDPNDSEELQKDKKNKPFKLDSKLILKGVYTDERNPTSVFKPFNFNLNIPEGYTWDGASIPKPFQSTIGGKGSPEFLFASLVHDYLCENKALIKHNRYLSSLILKEILLACGTSLIKANIMFYAVDKFQRFQGW